VIIDEALAAVRRQGGEALRSAIAGNNRMRVEELATLDDPGLFGPSSVVWRVHGDAAMLIGGLRALLIQTLHPLAMAGVAEHSDYRTDPWGRLHRTGRFVGSTTYGNTETAETAIQVVRRVHDRVTGIAPDGRPYAANDPHLLLWVHVTEVDSFLTAFERYGYGNLTDAEKDRYVAEMGEVARRLGSAEPPTTRAELAEVLEAFRAECHFGDQARDALRFLLRPDVPLALRGPYGLITAAAVASLPGWARRMLRLPLPPGVTSLAINPPATLMTRIIGWMMSDRNLDIEDHLLSTG
jgi:uncharacterized protein (DUF2236 family)